MKAAEPSSISPGRLSGDGTQSRRVVLSTLQIGFDYFFLAAASQIGPSVESCSASTFSEAIS
jgi:hypothetical protein